MQNVTDVSFAPEVLDAEGITLVKFWAPWCGPCKVLAPSLDKVAERYAGRVKVVGMNVDEAQDTPAKYSIRGIPAMLAFKDGKIVHSATGAKTEGQLIQMFDRLLAEHSTAETKPLDVDDDDFLSGVVPQAQDGAICESCQ